MTRSFLFTGVVLAALGVLPAAAQTVLPFALRFQQGTTVQSPTDGGLVSFPADAIGRATDGVLSVTYRGAGTATVNQIDLTGSTDFAVVSGPDLPQTMIQNQTFTVNLRYRPTASARVTGALRIGYTEVIAPGTVPRVSSFSMTLVGTTPEFGFSFVPQPVGSNTQLAPGDTIPFPATLVNEAATALVIVTNRGSGTGVVNLVTLSGTVFSLVGLPLTPISIDPGRDTRFTVRYAPLQIETSTGAVRVELIDRTVTFPLQGAANGPLFSYDVLQESSATAVLPGQAISIPDTLVGNTSSVVVRVRNTGSADGRIPAINILGSGYQLAELPFLPYVMTAGSTFSFTIHFSPTAPGRSAGKLRIGADLFDVNASGLGSTLSFAYTAGTVTTAVLSNGSVIFPPIAVGQTSSVRFAITNNGTAAGPINSISTVTAGTLFTLTRVPALPANLAPGESIEVNVIFTPTATGSVTGTLKVDSQSFTLSAVGNTPAPLSDYRFTGSSGAQEPGAQVSVGLSLASAHALPLNGTLTLAFTSEVFSNDPAVQFATGGRTVAFTIPAGSTQAVFPNNASSIRLQTGTVAGTIAITPSFVTDGGIVLTPATPPALSLTVPQSAPRLLNVQVSGKSTNTFNLLITGFATGRNVTQIDVQFAGVAGETLGTTKVSVNVESSFSAWYQSTASQQFGSQFTATLPFTLQGDVKAVGNVADAVQSATITLINRQGTSTARTAELK